MHDVTSEKFENFRRQPPMPPSILEMATGTIAFFGVAAGIGYLISLCDTKF